MQYTWEKTAEETQSDNVLFKCWGKCGSSRALMRAEPPAATAAGRVLQIRGSTRGEGSVLRAAASPHHASGFFSLWTEHIFVPFLCLELFAVLPNTRNVKRD